MSNTIWVNYSSGDKPRYSTPWSAGCDLSSTEDLVVPAGKWVAVPTGLKVAIPPGNVGFVCPRSGLAVKHGVTVLNAPGVIDSDYRGEIKVLLINHSDQDYSVKKGDRIAQIIFSPVAQAILTYVDQLSDTTRGEGGFGSTGI